MRCLSFSVLAAQNPLRCFAEQNSTELLLQLQFKSVNQLQKKKDTRERVFSFSTKSVLADGINPSSMGEITCVMKSDFVGLGDGFNFICEADFIQATLGFHREHKRTISLFLAPPPLFCYNIPKAVMICLCKR